MIPINNRVVLRFFLGDGGFIKDKFPNNGNVTHFN